MRPEATDSNLVLELPASLERPDGQPRQALPQRELQKLEFALARVRPAWRQRELAAAREKQLDAQAAWQLPSLARERFLRVPREERLQALKQPGEEAPQVLLRRHSTQALRDGPVRK